MTYPAKVQGGTFGDERLNLGGPQAQISLGRHEWVVRGPA
jgi:hypothetical protein